MKKKLLIIGGLLAGLVAVVFVGLIVVAATSGPVWKPDDELATSMHTCAAALNTNDASKVLQTCAPAENLIERRMSTSGNSQDHMVFYKESLAGVAGPLMEAYQGQNRQSDALRQAHLLLRDKDASSGLLPESDEAKAEKSRMVAEASKLVASN